MGATQGGVTSICGINAVNIGYSLGGLDSTMKAVVRAQNC